MASLHSRRVASETDLLERMVALNPGVLRVDVGPCRGDGTRAGFEIFSSPALRWQNGRPATVRGYRGEIRMPRFFPSVPIEVHLDEAIFHPNADTDGFVCLWGDFSSQYTCVEALMRLQRIAAWDLVNCHPEQVIQPAALAWYRAEKVPSVPLTFLKFASPETSEYYPARPAGRRRILD